MTVLDHTTDLGNLRDLRGRGADAIAAAVEAAIRDGRLFAGERLPTVRALAEHLRVSPTTVSAAYKTLAARGLVVARGRRGTAVSPRPPVYTSIVSTPALVEPGARDVAQGNPDPELLPPLAPALAAIDTRPRLYAEDLNDPGLLRVAARRFEADGLPHRDVAVVGGALDGIERVLLAHLRPGDRVAIEDPAFVGVRDLLAALGLVAAPVAVDEDGPLPGALERALRHGARAVVVTPRAQNPFGAALDDARVAALGRVLDRHPGVLVIEDDHAGDVAGAPARTLCAGGRARFAIVRSVSKSLGPDLRLAVMSADEETQARVEGRQLLGIRWVSHVLQRTVAALWRDRSVARRLRRAERTYTKRREALRGALAERGIRAHARSGLNVWVPVPEETRVIQALAAAGFAAQAGARYRLESAPAVRVTTASLPVEEAPGLADALADALAPVRRALST